MKFSHINMSEIQLALNRAVWLSGPARLPYKKSLRAYHKTVLTLSFHDSAKLIKITAH
jgi:hypothetical protein